MDKIDKISERYVMVTSDGDYGKPPIEIAKQILSDDEKIQYVDFGGLVITRNTLKRYEQSGAN